ncbi:mechanosensitive ion channel family protein [Labrenzia sp. CE80]|uniref:mechanosensitive ion channel family protein n=1 Tax=Labrenzia sp. CE80 TaxID=1788986 RepID=UPI001AD8D1D6|nr:mechanosensitive ion channel family protein [Labrenzia sp. CE80]
MTARTEMLHRAMLETPLRVMGLFILLVAGVFWLGLLSSNADAQGAIGILTEFSQDKTETSTAPEEAADADTAVAAETRSMDFYVARAMKARDVVKQILQSAPDLHETMGATLRSKGGHGDMGWLWATLPGAGLALLLGLACYRLVLMWGRKHFAHRYFEGVQPRADRISYLFLRALLMLAGLVVFAGVSGMILLFLNTSGPASAHQTAVVILSVTTLFLGLRIVFLNLLVPNVPSHRAFALSDADARGLYLSLIAGTAVSAVALALCTWMDKLGLPKDAHKLALIASALLSCLILSSIAVAYRKAIGALIRGEAGDAADLWRRVLSKSWHLIAVVYFLAAWAISSIRILLDLPDATGLVVAPLQALLMAIIAYGLLVLLIDRVLLPRLDTAEVQATIVADIERAEATEGEGDLDPQAALSQAEAEAADLEAHRSPYRHLLDHGASILSCFGGLVILARLWGVSITDGSTYVGGTIEILLIIFLGYMAYKAVEVAIDRRIAKEGPSEEKDEEAEVGGAGESRIATLLPIFRNFLLITIVAIAAMVVLSELGVNIAPLFAGAGVVGLAIGFGAQTLIRDIFSGAFYLLDDAFRRGEYIDIGSAKGVVERISIRSMQLRHHRGALTTIPFGEIQHVENFSRDWAMMKLAFRVTYDTDVDKMRKIIKKFGQELLDDEYYGPMFLQPLKSQGILAMEDSAMIARVKFMTKPGKQFELRKVVYAGLQDLFEKNGIKFAHKQVTVRVAGGDEKEDEESGGAPSAAVRAAAAGAAAGMLDETDLGGDDSADQL